MRSCNVQVHTFPHFAQMRIVVCTRDEYEPHVRTYCTYDMVQVFAYANVDDVYGVVYDVMTYKLFKFRAIN